VPSSDDAPPLPPTPPPPGEPATPSPAVQQARGVALAALIGLIVLGLLWEAVLAPTGRGTLALKVVPLALCVAGVWRHRMYVYRVLALLVWLYVVEGLMRGVAEQGLSQRLALLQVFFSVLLFGACGAYVRLRFRDAAAKQKPA
jgi:uncharacterized membrane protein